MLVRQSVFVVPPLAAVAERGGHFAAAGLNVRTQRVISSAEQWSELRAGDCDVAVTAIDNLFVWNAEAGPRIALVAQIETTTLLTLVLRPGLASLADLPAPRLGVDAPHNGFAVVLRTMTAALGLGSGDEGFVAAGGVRQRLDALLGGTIDATLLSAPLDAVAVAAGGTVALTVGDCLSGYPGLGVVVSPAADPRTVDRYLASLTAALEWVRAAGPDEVRELLAGDDQGPAAAEALLATLPTSLEPDPAGLRLLAALREDLGMSVPGAPAPDDLLRAAPR